MSLIVNIKLFAGKLFKKMLHVLNEFNRMKTPLDEFHLLRKSEVQMPKGKKNHNFIAKYIVYFLKKSF